jgi:outer membrane protein assembly factor BamB
MADLPASVLSRPPLRWWPAWLVLALAAVAVGVVRWREALTFQQRNMATMGIALATLVLLLLWWVLLSRAPARLRVGVTAGALAVLLAGVGLLRIRGVSGDLVPILEWRWRTAPTVAGPVVATAAVAPDATGPAAGVVSVLAARPDFPRFLGPDRTGVLAGPALAADWDARPPEVRWRIPVGAGWSGFALVGDRALTQEQHGAEERVVCYDVRTGRPLWAHADPARYANPIGGEGPRATPTVEGGRVFTLGATGRLNALDLATGRRLWTRDLVAETGATVPEWGYAGSPLVLDGRVVASAGGPAGKSLVAYRADTGEPVWAAGDGAAGYGAPFVATLAGRRQILAFNHRGIVGHDAGDGAVLWEFPWGRGQPHVAVPVVAGPASVVFSSGYGVGSARLDLTPGASGARWGVERAWHSLRLKAKFSNPVVRDGFVYGLDDGIFACLDVADGALRWKAGRYGHGQGLLVGEHYLLMAEEGELVLLRPTPDGPGELHRFRVFPGKTWNPPALAGDVLVVRNDREAVALRLPLAAAR